MEKRFSLVLLLVLGALVFASYLTPTQTGEIVRAARSTPIESLESLGGPEQASAAGEEFCACPYSESHNVRITQDDCKDTPVATCRNSLCSGFIRVSTPTGSYKQEPFEKSCKVYKKELFCDCPLYIDYKTGRTGPSSGYGSLPSESRDFYKCKRVTPCSPEADPNACSKYTCKYTCDYTFSTYIYINSRSPLPPVEKKIEIEQECKQNSRTTEVPP